MGIERGGGEYYRSYNTPENRPENFFEKEPRLYRNFLEKNKLISKLYGFASGQSHASPTPYVANPQQALEAYIDATSQITAPTTPIIPKPKLPGVIADDPYANHPFRMAKDDHVYARAIFELMQAGRPEIDSVVALLDKQLVLFARDFANLPNVPQVDKADISGKLPSGIGLDSFREALMVLVAKYIALKAKLGDSPQGELEETIKSGLFAYAKTFSNDIPFYDKAYAEFDAKRADGRDPQEVYLGRDGMYAHIGRRAMDVSGRRAMGHKKRQKLIKQGKRIDIPAKYLVYPRYFRDNLAQETKSAYLESQGICALNDPIFFDTGFRGSVPEQILGILGLGNEADERIKMLSAEKEERKIKGISSDRRREIVNNIEYNVKPEEPASAILQTSGGKLKPVAMPTTPEEQFIFGMVRMALVRHYWLNARLG